MRTSVSTANRRQFLSATTVASLALLSSGRLHAADAARPTADELIPGKDKRLIVHNAQHFEIETPLDLLRAQQVTPVSALFVRNNQQPSWSPTLKPADTTNWNLLFTGLVEYPRLISLASISELPRIEHEMVLQCSGNGRALFGHAAAVKGSPWEHGAVANVRFRGVPLKAVLEKFDVRPDSTARFLTAEGDDSPGKPADADFEHSLPLNETLERSILAIELNGQPLPAVHGGPLRLITPGYYGTMQVKWLTRLRFEGQETVNHHQVKRYRTPLKPIEPGSKFDYGFDNSEPNWNMKIKSLMFSPLDGERLSPGRALLRGVAWNDGIARIDAVEWSQNGGKTWQRAELQVPGSPYAWYPWQADIKLDAGEHVLMCRAVDRLGRTQPLDGAVGWNPAGYGWNGVQSVKITVAS